MDFEEEDIQAPKSQSDVFSQDDAGDIFAALAICTPSISFEDFLQPFSFPLDPPPPLDQTWESLSAHAMSVMASFNFHDDAYFRYLTIQSFFFVLLIVSCSFVLSKVSSAVAIFISLVYLSSSFSFLIHPLFRFPFFVPFFSFFV